jgi:putative lipoprotein (rSAM/lipoprotein system)
MTRISKIYRILISTLLALLGFSCGNREREFVAAYGTPSATYKAKGVVVSEADGSPIKGIRIKFKNNRFDPNNAAYTDSEGSFTLKSLLFPYQKQYVELTDVDGEENGLFAGMEIEADYTNATFTEGSGNWYSGQAEIDLGTIKMKPENKDES